MQRASVLLGLLERVVRSMVRDESRKSLSDGEIRAILVEMLRVELARLIEFENAEHGLDELEVETRIAALEAENDRLREAARQRDWSQVSPKLAAAGRALSVPVPEPMPAGLARRAGSLQRRVNEVEIAVHDGEDVRSAARGLISEYADVAPARFLEAPILLSRAVDQAASREMANKVRATGEVALQFWGDIPLSALETEKLTDLFCFISRLPRDHGRKHGNNRYNRSRGVLSKHEEFAAADRADEAIRT